MAAKDRTGSRPEKRQQFGTPPARDVGTAIHAAISRGFVVGREVLVGTVPGIVVGYNITLYSNIAPQVVLQGNKMWTTDELSKMMPSTFKQFIPAVQG